jgi:hypothetical protein
MDLAAFLAPGVYPVFLVGSHSDGGPWGHVLSRPGRGASWVAGSPAASGDRLVLTLRVPGHGLEDDGSLVPVAGAGVFRPRDVPGAEVVVSALVRSCRADPGGRGYVLLFAELVRVLD